MTEAPVRTKKSMQPKQVRPYTADDTLTHGVTRGDLLLRCLERAKIELGDCLLDVGCGYGGISIAYARTGRAAISIDINPSNIAVLQSRLDAGEAGPGKVMPHEGSALSIPVDDEVADLATMIGVIEWMGYTNDALDPRELQLIALKECLRSLRPGGHLIIGTKNRLFPRYVLKDAQTRKPLVNILPRPIAKYISKRFWAQDYRGYIYSYWGWRKLLSEAGFQVKGAYVPIYSYQYPLYLAPLWTRVRLREELKQAANDLDPGFPAVATESRAPGRPLYYECFANLGLLGASGGTFILVCQKPGARRS